MSDVPVHGIWRPAANQLNHWLGWREELDLDIGDEEFAAVVDLPVPEFTDNPWVAVTLTWYGGDDPYQNLWQIWHVVGAEQETNFHWDDWREFNGPDQLRLLGGINHPQRGFRWERIDMGCNRDRSPEDMRNAKTSPHLGVIASVAMHPHWVRAMDGDEMPYVFVPGYEVDIPSHLSWRAHSSWRGVPTVSYRRDSRRVELCSNWRDGSQRLLAVPSFV